MEKWHDPLQKYHDDSERALAEFAGDANDQATILMESFRQYITTLMQLSNIDNSTVLSGSAVSILEAISKCNKYRESSTVILTEFHNVFAEVNNDLKNVALKLHSHIGILALKESVCQKKLNYEPTQKKLLRLMSLVARIADTLLKGPDPTIEAKQSVLILSFIFWYLQMVGQGLKASVLDLEIRNNCDTSQNTNSIAVSFSNALASVHKSVSIRSESLVKTFTDFLNDFIKINLALNTALKDKLDFDGVGMTVEEIARSLFDSSRVATSTN